MMTILVKVTLELYPFVKLFTSDECHVFGRPWAWWAALVTLVLMILTATVTFLLTTPADLFAGMHLAETEREILANVPTRDISYCYSSSRLSWSA